MVQLQRVPPRTTERRNVMSSFNTSYKPPQQNQYQFSQHQQQESPQPSSSKQFIYNEEAFSVPSSTSEYENRLTDSRMFETTEKPGPNERFE